MITLFNTRTNTPLRAVRLPGAKSGLGAAFAKVDGRAKVDGFAALVLSFHPAGGVLMAAGNDGAVHFYDLALHRLQVVSPTCMLISHNDLWGR